MRAAVHATSPLEIPQDLENLIVEIALRLAWPGLPGWGGYVRGLACRPD